MDDKLVKTWIDEAYEKTIDRIRSIEGVSKDKAFRMLMYRNDFTSVAMAYSNYLYGYFDSMIYARFLAEYGNMPTESENKEIMNLMRREWDKLRAPITQVAKTNYELDRKYAL